jgi:hypothetical protein
MLDEVNGRRFQLRNSLDHGTPLSCRQADRCTHCFIEPFCTATDRVAARTQADEWEVFDVGEGPAPDELPFGATLLGVDSPVDSPFRLYLRGAPPETEDVSSVLVADTAAQVEAWLTRAGEMDVELNRDTAPVLLRRRADVRAALDRLRIHQPGRATLQESARDVRDPATFFAALDLPIAVSGLPACAVPGARVVPPRAILARDLFDPETGRLSTHRLAQRHIEQTYFGKSIRCRECAVTDRCEGFPIQMVRDQGLRLARPLDAANVPELSPRLADGRPPQGPTPGLPGFGAPRRAVDPLARLSADHAARRRRRRLEILG